MSSNSSMRSSRVVILLMSGFLGCFLPHESGFAAPASGKAGNYGPGGASNFGIGFQVGAPSGIAAKYWLNRRAAIDGAFGWRSGDVFEFQSSFLWHDRDIFSLPKDKGELPFYLGGGLRVTANDAEAGLRGVVGLTFLPAKVPFDVFLEAGPILVFAPRVSGDFDAAFGARYYFR